MWRFDFQLYFFIKKLNPFSHKIHKVWPSKTIRLFYSADQTRTCSCLEPLLWQIYYYIFTVAFEVTFELKKVSMWWSTIECRIETLSKPTSCNICTVCPPKMLPFETRLNELYRAFLKLTHNLMDCHTILGWLLGESGGFFLHWYCIFCI